jgi:hypothetical protein
MLALARRSNKIGGVMTRQQLTLMLFFIFGTAGFDSNAAEMVTPLPDTGFRGIWYFNQPQNDRFKYKYSGGFATYPQQHIPLAVYAPEVRKTFFCYGGAGSSAKQIRNLIAYYDHATNQVSRPRILLERQTHDAHYNPTMAIDARGYLYVFCNSHGLGVELPKDDPTHGKSFVYRSVEPYSIDRFRLVLADNFSYSQVWPVEGKGLLWLHTKYEQGRRRLFWRSTEDGLTWTEAQPLVSLRSGSYQISWARRDRVGTAFDVHPEKGGLNARTNIYYLETRDFGRTWRTVGGNVVQTPLKDAGVASAALVHDFEREGLLVYLKDLAFDAQGNPIILYLTTRGYKSGPESGPREWWTAHWTGSRWERREITESDHNYDHGSLYVEPDGTWRVIAPTDPGPQPDSTGGAVVIHASVDQGQTWRREAPWLIENGRNQTYVRRPLDAHEGFYAYWADGNALERSESSIYFGTKEGGIFRLPREMTTDHAPPEPVRR